MAVTLTTSALRLRLTRLLHNESVPEVAALLSWVTDQVAQWKIDAPSGGVLSWTQFYENQLATLQAQILALADRVAAQGDIEIEDTTTHPMGESSQSRKKHSARGLERALERLIKERDKLLGQLGIPTAEGPYPALLLSTIRAEETTVGSYSTASPGTDWTKRDADSPYFDNREESTSITRKDR